MAQQENYGGVTQLPVPSLRPETIRTYEVVMEQSVGEKVRFTLTGFNSRIRNLIGQENSDPADPDSPFLFRNAGENWATGGEAEIEAKWPGFPAVGKHPLTARSGSGRTLGDSLFLISSAPIAPGAALPAVSMVPTTRIIRESAPRQNDLLSLPCREGRTLRSTGVSRDLRRSRRFRSARCRIHPDGFPWREGLRLLD